MATPRFTSWHYEYVGDKVLMVYRTTLQHRNIKVVLSNPRYIEMLRSIGYQTNQRMSLGFALKIIAKQLNNMTEEEIEALTLEAMVG